LPALIAISQLKHHVKKKKKFLFKPRKSAAESLYMPKCSVQKLVKLI